MNNDFLTNLESTYGIDLAFDVITGVQGTKDVLDNRQFQADPSNDFRYTRGTEALAQELQRLFDLTPIGSLIDDPGYGIDWGFIGDRNDPTITIPLARVAIRKALEHPSFSSRFRVASLEVWFDVETPNALWSKGILECFGFSGVQHAQWGPLALRWLSLGETYLNQTLRGN
jgi:hypothetical protein